MEKLLMLWVEDHIKKCAPLSLLTVQVKSRSLLETLKEQVEEDYIENFTASHSWFNRFKRRFSLHNIWVAGEAASADKGAAKKVENKPKNFFFFKKP